MKTYNSIYKRLIVFCCFLSALVLSANAQWDVRNLNLVIDWQVNAPFSTGYADKQTLQLSPTESLTTDQQRSAFQVPFGVVANYKLWDGKHFVPYVGLKAGTMFARNTTYYGIKGLYDKAWGGYVSPEIGFNIYPCKTKKWGFHVAGYYSYGTNKTYTLTSEINGQNNAGFRVGVIF